MASSTANRQMNFSWVHLYMLEGQSIFPSKHVPFCWDIPDTPRNTKTSVFITLSLLGNTRISSNNCSFYEREQISASRMATSSTSLHTATGLPCRERSGMQKNKAVHEAAGNTYANHSVTQHKTQPEKGKAIGLQH